MSHATTAKRGSAPSNVRSVFPCCRKAVVFDIDNVEGTDLYQRRCPACARQWFVTRSTVRSGEARIDNLMWETTDPVYTALGTRAKRAVSGGAGDE